MPNPPDFDDVPDSHHTPVKVPTASPIEGVRDRISAIERLLPMPLGQSVLGVGRKPLKAVKVMDVRYVGRKAA